MESQVVATPQILDRYRGAIGRELRRFLGVSSLPFSRMLHYHLGFADRAGKSTEGYLGKALRPSLLLFACEALGGEWAKALPAAVAIELVHNFSLVHDDIQDNDLERHGRPTVWRLWGVGQAINVGDALRELAALALLQSAGDLPPEQALRASAVLGRAVLEMIEGQYLDLLFEERPLVTIQDYLEMAERKTGALLGAALELGALLAGAGDESVALFRNCGRKLGICFQIKDDVLGIWGDQTQTGKSTKNDLLRKKKSLPIVYALNRDGHRIRTIYHRPTLEEANLPPLIEALEETGAQRWAEELAEDHCRQGLAELRRAELLPGWAQEELEELTRFLLTRER